MFIQFLKTRVGISLICALLIVSGAFAFRNQDEKVKKESLLNTQIALVAEKSVKKGIENGQIDTKSWENTLKDLIGTSTLDESVTSLIQNTSSSTVSDKPLTATDRFSQVFFTKYVELKKSGAVIDENTGIRLVNELLTQDYGGPNAEKIYTASDIISLNTSTSASIRKYANNLGIIFDKPAPADYENELVIINRVNETQNKKDLVKLAQNIARYTEIRQDLLDTPVPKALKNTHLALVNSFSFIVEGVKGMALIETDPVGATKMILKYEDGLKAIDILSKQLSVYFKQQQIIFSSSEPGYIFTE